MEEEEECQAAIFSTNIVYIYFFFRSRFGTLHRCERTVESRPRTGRSLVYVSRALRGRVSAVR